MFVDELLRITCTIDQIDEALVALASCQVVARLDVESWPFLGRSGPIFDAKLIRGITQVPVGRTRSKNRMVISLQKALEFDRANVNRHMLASQLDVAHKGLWLSLNHALLLIGREAVGREASPSARVIDNQSVKTTESGGPRGYDAGKKIKGRKRHILADTYGNLVHAVMHTADIQDRDGAPLVLTEIIQRFPWLRHIFPDGGYAGDKLRQALRKIAKSKWTIEIIKRSDTAKGFEVLPRHWVVERTFAWLSRNRRLAKDFEQTIASATAWLFIASIQLFTRRIAIA